MSDESSTASEQVVISPMRHRHLDAVLAIEEASHPVPWTRPLFEGELGRGDRHYVIARVGDRIIGYAGMILILDQGHISTIAVDPSQRGRRHASRLLIELVEEAERRGISSLTLEVRVSNEPAQALYRRFGFTESGVRHRYYTDGEDAFVMWLHDLGSPAEAERRAGLGSTLSPPTLRSGFVDGREPTGDPTSGHPSGRDTDSGRPLAFGFQSRFAHPAEGSDPSSGRMER